MFLTAQGGFLGPFAWLLGKLMNLIYILLADKNGLANIGICIIVFTLVVKLILLPFTLKQQKSAKINMMIQPEIRKIQKKYAGKKDQESMMKQQKETQEVFSKYGTSMTGGCLTSLIQLPILYALYRVIQNIPAYVGKVYEMYQPVASSIFEAKGSKIQEFMTAFMNDNNITTTRYIMSKFESLDKVDVNNVIDVLSYMKTTDISALLEKLNLSQPVITSNVANIDKIHMFCGIDISAAPGWHFGLPLLIPVLSAFFQWLSMKVTSVTPADENDPSANMMKSMTMVMPFTSLLITTSLPAAIGLYWAMSALFTVFIQLVINYYYNHIIDQEAFLQKQMELAKVKNAKKGNKKSFMERMMDQSASMQEEYEKQLAMKNNSAKSLKNYVASDSAKNTSNENKTYKQGSIGAKANIMKNYNSSSNKEEK